MTASIIRWLIELYATSQLAEYCAGLQYQDLSDKAISMSKAAIADAIAVALVARDLPWTDILAEHVRETGSQGRSSVWGRSQRCSPAGAAMVNGTAVHGIEMDDRHFDLNVHNGAATIPAAFSLAEHQGASGRDLILAVVCGYEVAFRVARATKQCISSHYPNSLKTAFGAAAAAAKALRLDPISTGDSLGNVGSFASGLWQFKVDARGGMVKRVQGGGWPSHSGVVAAMLAHRGLSGPSSILEGPDGMLQAFSTENPPNEEALTDSLGDGFEIEGWETKLYAAWGISHSSIDAVKELCRNGIAPEEIERLEIHSSSKVLGNISQEIPTSLMAAQYCLNFIVSAAFYYDLTDPLVWDEGLLKDERISALVPRVVGVIDEEREGIFQTTNDHGGVRMQVTLMDGRRREVDVRHAKGTPGNPPSAIELEEKARTLLSHRLAAPEVDRFLSWVHDLDAATNVHFDWRCVK